MPHDPSSIELAALTKRFPDHANTTVAIVNISRQQLSLYRENRLVKTYPISTSRYGIGNQEGSNQTPLGVHCIREKIGTGAPLGTIFKGRKSTQQIARIITDRTETPADDFITTRILWLAGLEPGINQGEGIDSYARYIYIHGTHEEGLIGQPASHGCVRMINRDVVELHDEMREDDLVVIAQ